MPKLKNVSVDELQACIDAAQEAGQQAAHMATRAAQGYLGDVQSPIQLASSFMGASAALAELARHLLMRAALQEQRAELESRLRSPTEEG